MMTPLYSSIIGCLLLLIGFGFGFTPYHPPYQVIHLSIGSIFFLMVPMMVYVHIQRFYIKGADDWVAWMHFVALHCSENDSEVVARCGTRS